MTRLSPNHNYAADECIAQIPQHHIPTAEEKVRASESFDKSVLVAAHLAALHDAYILEMGTHPVNEVTIKPASPTSSIGGLKSSTLKQLKVGKVHRRRVVVGTLCTKTLCTKSHNGVMLVNVFEDEEGNATPIYLSNAMEGNGGSAQGQRLYPQDSKVAVKEPYLTRLPDGEVVLLVEKTTDLVFLWVPDYVEENGAAKAELKENGVYENCRDAFAMEKGKEDPDGFANDGVHKEVEEKDGGLDVVANEKSNGLHEDSVEDESMKSSRTSRELKFEDMMDVKGEKDRAESVNDEKPIGNLQGHVAVDEDGNGTSASREMFFEDMTDVKGEKAKEGEEVDATKGEDLSREINLEDMPAMCKHDENGGDAAEENKEEKGGVNVAKLNGVEVQAICEEKKLYEDVKEVNVPNQEKYGAPLGDADAGESAASLRVRGNALFARGDYNKATIVYMRAAEKARIDGLQMEEVLCLSNRAEVWLRLCRNQAAFDDAEAALKILRECGVNTEGLAMAKVLFRKGRALMGLHKYEDAMRVLQEVLGKAPADRQLREAAIKCRARLQHALKPGKRQRAAANRKKSAGLNQQ
eukprot:c23868_g1_i2 orf=256-1998(+)